MKTPNEGAAKPLKTGKRTLCWRTPDGWMALDTAKRSNRRGEPLPPVAVYYREGEPVAYQYLLTRRPTCADELP